MWYPATVTVLAVSEPVTLAQARTQCRIDASDTDFDNDLNQLIKAARSYVEEYCGTRFATQTVVVKCDRFADFDRIPETPAQSISSISYIDGNGDLQTLPTSVYELRADGIEAAIVLKNGQVWPTIQSGSRISATLVVGFDAAPSSVVHAMLVFINDHFERKENAEHFSYSAIDALLSNHRKFG